MKRLVIIMCILCVVVFCSCSQKDNATPETDTLPTEQVVTPETETYETIPSIKDEIIPNETITPFTSETLESPPPEFCDDDWGMLGVRFGDSLETIISVLGEPESRETHYSPAYEEDIITCKYDFGHIFLFSYGVGDIMIDSPGYLGCRGIQVGDSIQSVLDKFPGAVTSEPDISGRNYIYGDANSRNHAFLNVNYGGSIASASFVCREIEGKEIAPVALRLDFENDCVVSMRLLLPL